MSPVDLPTQYLLSETFRPSSSPYADRASLTVESGPRVIRVERKGALPVASWLRSAVSRIEGLTALAAGWDSHEAQPVEADNAMQAVRFLLDNVDSSLPEPSIVPLADGGIQIEWHRGGIDVEITFADIDSGIYVEERSTGFVAEDSLMSAAGILGQFTARIAQT